MSLYERWILPRLTHLSMRQKQLATYRARALAGVRGRVLEIGIGSGLNLPFYGHGVQRVLGIDPSPELVRLAEKATGRASFPVEFLTQSAEEMPLENDSIDTAVTTWILCTIPDAVKALREVRRVLQPDRLLIFVEHGRSPEPRVIAWQDRLTPLWKRCSGGCRLNRKIDDLIRQGGFNIAELQTGYAKGPRPMAFMYEGRARNPKQRPGIS